MKKKMTYIILFILMFFIYNNVQAGEDHGGGSGGGVKGCTSNYCFKTTVGFRLTIVDQKTGQRCKYDENSNTICSSTGKSIASKDFWFDTGQLYGLDSGNCFAQQEKRTKSEFILSSGSDIVNCRGNSSSPYSSNNTYQFTYLGFPGMNSDSYYRDWIINGNANYNNTPQNMDIIVEWLKCKEGQATGNCTSKRGAAITKDYTIFNNILNTLIYNNKAGNGSKKIDVSSLSGLENTYIQFEQLIQVYDYQKKGYTSFAPMGTVAEVSWIWSQRSGGGKWCFTQAYNTSYGAIGCSTSIIAGGYVTGWRGVQDIGAGNYKLSAISANDLSALKSTNDVSKFWKKDTANVYNYWLKNVGGGCDADLRQALKKTNEADYNAAIKKITTQSYYTSTCGSDGSKCPFLNYSFSEIKTAGYQNSTTAKCSATIPCATMAKGIWNNRNSLNLKNKSGTVIATNYEDAIKKFALIYDGKTSSDYETNQWNQIYIEMQKRLNASFFPTTCAPVTCNNSNIKKIYKNFGGSSSYEPYVSWLYRATGAKFPLLQTHIWQSLGETAPSCYEPPKNCDASPFDFDCGDTVLLEDHAYGENSSSASRCWQQGFAYTNGGGYVRSLHRRLTDECNLYCSEQVKFNLPDATYNTAKAGTVFKWGVNNNKSDEIFGTMTVSVSCKVRTNPNATGPCHEDEETGEEWCEPPSCKGVSVDYDPTDWYRSVNTTMSLSYEEPSGVYNKTQSLDMIHPGITGDYSGSLRGTCRNQECTNLGVRSMWAKYQYNYPDGFKWYSNKKDGSIVDATNNDTQSNKSYYYEIGYGLPTSFITPAGDYGAMPSSNGKLSVTINSVGIDGHFDNLIRIYGGEGLTSFDYSCSFKIDNELFGDECKYNADGTLKSGSPKYCDKRKDDQIENNSEVKGVDVVFRVVKLVNSEANIGKAFPGRTGNGSRVKGTNWNKLSNTDIVKILNANIYTKKPMFEITLNTANIKDIRDWNKKAKHSGKDPYSEFTPLTSGNSSSDSNGYIGYKCFERNGNKYCASSFLSKLSGYKDKQKLTGTCMTSTDTTDRAKKNVNGC